MGRGNWNASRFFMRSRKSLNSPWVATPLIYVGLSFLWQKVRPGWHERSDLFKGAALGVIVSATAGFAVYLLTQYFDRRVKRYNALCHLELTLNHLLTNLSDNQLQLKKSIDSDNPTLLFPARLTLSEPDIREIGRVKLKNKLLNTLIDCEKYSHDLEAVIAISERNIQMNKELYLHRSSDPQYIQQILKDIHRQSKAQLKELHGFGDLVNESIKDTLVDVRFFAQIDRPAFVGLAPYYGKSELEDWRVRDLKKLETEMAQTATEDEARRKTT